MINKLLRETRPFLIVILLLFLAYIIPGGGDSATVSTTLGVVGLLFAILVGFYLNDLFNRFQNIRNNVAVEVSGLQTYYIFVQVLNKYPGHKKFAKESQKLIDEYVRKFFDVEWHNYGALDPHFNAIIKSLENVGPCKTTNETETYTNLLPLLNQITTSREKLYMYGKDKLSIFEWLVIYLLAGILLFSIFFINDGTLSSVFITGALSSAVVILIVILNDLNNMSYGEEVVSFEPYETIFDVIEMPRYYRQQDVDSGRVKLPSKGVKYRLVK